jgi:hypothetical protein
MAGFLHHLRHYESPRFMDGSETGPAAGRRQGVPSVAKCTEEN